MTLGEFRTMLLARLNRTDATDALADSFISEGITRIQREVRAPFMERVFYIDAEDGPIESFLMPSDYIEGIDVLVDGVPLVRKTFRLLAMDVAQGPPKAYARYSNLIYVRGPAPVGSRTELLYYGAFSGLSDDNDTNELLAAAPDLALYAALSVAGDHFQHEKTPEWEARYLANRDAVQMQAIEDEMRGGPQAVQAAYMDPGV